LDRLKIDRSFIQRIGLNADDDVIIKAIIAIAKGLNLEILAEGVETKKQVDFLKTENCGAVQGFLFNEPLQFDECTQLLKKLNKPPL
jgi:EAL domain-containing protein (putative c-di-GMP-specific phosphodiesterase class I)